MPSALPRELAHRGAERHLGAGLAIGPGLNRIQGSVELDFDRGAGHRPPAHVRYLDHYGIAQRLAHPTTLGVARHHRDAGRLSLAGQDETVTAAGSQGRRGQEREKGSVSHRFMVRRMGLSH